MLRPLVETALPTAGQNSLAVDTNTTRLLTDVSYTLVFETALPLVAPVVFAASLAFLQVRDSPTGSLMSPTSRPLSTCRVAMVPGETRRARGPGAQRLASLPPSGPGCCCGVRWQVLNPAGHR